MKSYLHIFCLLPVFLINGEQPAKELEKEGAKYLQNIMNKLQNERNLGHPVDMEELSNMLEMDKVSEDPTYLSDEEFRNTMRKPPYPPSGTISGPTPLPPVAVENQPLPQLPPPPELSKEEILALYQAAIQKGASLPDFQASDTTNSPSTMLTPPPVQHGPAIKPVAQGVTGSLPGYYYYFYPIKSFVVPKNETPSVHSTTPSALDSVMMMMKPDEKNKAVEPLFMAVSGFIGMALTFVFSVLFLPKFGIFRKVSGGDGAYHKLKSAPEDFAALTRILVDSMDGKDCKERVACEVGRIMKKMGMDMKPIKILEIIVPPAIGKQIAMIRKSVIKKEKCNFISCKFINPRPPPTTPVGNKKPTNKKPDKNSMTPHELWMKRFEKEKEKFKQPANIWQNKKTKNQIKDLERL